MDIVVFEGPSLIVYCTDKYKTQIMFDSVVSDNASSIVYCPDKYKTRKLCDKAVDDCLAALKLVPDWFVTSEIIKNLFTDLYADENTLCLNESSGDAEFNCNGMGILNIDLNNIDLDNNFDEDDPDTIIAIRLLAWYIKFEKLKELKKELSEELMLVAWHPSRWWDWCMSEDEKKEIDLMFIEEL